MKNDSDNKTKSKADKESRMKIRKDKKLKASTKKRTVSVGLKGDRESKTIKRAEIRHGGRKGNPMPAGR